MAQDLQGLCVCLKARWQEGRFACLVEGELSKEDFAPDNSVC